MRVHLTDSDLDLICKLSAEHMAFVAISMGVKPPQDRWVLEGMLRAIVWCRDAIRWGHVDRAAPQYNPQHITIINLVALLEARVILRGAKEEYIIDGDFSGLYNRLQDLLEDLGPVPDTYPPISLEGDPSKIEGCLLYQQ